MSARHQPSRLWVASLAASMSLTASAAVAAPTPADAEPELEPAAEAAPPAEAPDAADTYDEPPPEPADRVATEPATVAGQSAQPAWQWPPPQVPPGWAGAGNLPPPASDGAGAASLATDEASPVADVGAPLPRDLGHLLLGEVGFRSVFITDEGFEPYADGDINMLGQLAVAAHVLPLRVAPMTFGIGVEYDVGHRSAQTRGQETALTVHRLAGSVLVDATIVRHLHTFTRLAPGAVYLHGSIEDGALPGRPLVTDQWTWSLDTTGGVAVLLGAAGDDQDAAVGFWFSAEFGYSFAGEAQMSYAPANDEEDPRQFGAIHLPNLTPGGVINRFALGLSF